MEDRRVACDTSGNMPPPSRFPFDINSMTRELVEPRESQEGICKRTGKGHHTIDACSGQCIM